jgi:hydrogenase maturation protease
VNRILVAGLGNELRGDDAAGLLAVRALRALAPDGIDIEEHGDAASLTESMSRHEEVVVIDAVASDSSPGTVLQLSPDAASSRRATSSHGLGLRQAVALTQVLGANPTVRVFGITGRVFELGAEPSPGVVRAAAEVAARIRELFVCA